jgi:hypothetical protein
MINFELTCTPALFHTHGVFLEDDLGADLLPSPLQTHPIPIAIAAISLCGSSADAHPSARSIYLEKRQNDLGGELCLRSRQEGSAVAATCADAAPQQPANQAAHRRGSICAARRVYAQSRTLRRKGRKNVASPRLKPSDSLHRGGVSEGESAEVPVPKMRHQEKTDLLCHAFLPNHQRRELSNAATIGKTCVRR